MADDLADDPENWPRDPYVLLGVSPGIDTRELRKKYNALIRRFKPEQYPEQFRRIREAYDQVLVQEQWRRFDLPLPEPSPPAGPPPDNSRESAPIDDPPPGARTSESWTAPPPRRTLDAELDRLWTLAETGMIEEGYRGLRELEREHPDSREIAIRRYWLVTAFPELEPTRDPLEAIVRTLQADPGQSPMWGEVRLRAQIAPNWPFEPFFEEMLESARTPMPLSTLYDVRWQAAIQIGSWRLLLEDVPAARLRFGEHPSEWARMLLQVVDKLAWIGEPAANQAFEKLTAEIERCAKGDRALDFELDRLDFLRELAPQWFRVEPRSPLEFALHDFVSVSWRGRWEVVRTRIVELCRQMASNIPSALRTLDDWSKAWPLIFAQVVRTVSEGYHLNRPRPATPEDIRVAFDAFLATPSKEAIRSRVSLVQFFRDEQFLPEDLLQAIDRRTVAPSTAAALDSIEGDWAVRLLARAACSTAA